MESDKQSDIMIVGGRCAAAIAITIARLTPQYCTTLIVRNDRLRALLQKGQMYAQDTGIALPDNLSIGDISMLHCPKYLFAPIIPMANLYGFLQDIAQTLMPFRGTVLLASKGFSCHDDMPMLPTATCLAAIDKLQQDRIVLLSGGNLAGELWANCPMHIDVFGPRAKQVHQEFLSNNNNAANQTLSPHDAPDMQQFVEWISAAKNAYALCCGIALGKSGASHAAGIAALAQAEIGHFMTQTQSMDYPWSRSLQDDWNLSVIAGHTRNFQAGVALATTNVCPNTTLEGVTAARVFLRLFADHKIAHPVLSLARDYLDALK